MERSKILWISRTEDLITIHRQQVREKWSSNEDSKAMRLAKPGISSGGMLLQGLIPSWMNADKPPNNKHEYRILEFKGLALDGFSSLELLYNFSPTCPSNTFLDSF